MIKHSKADLRHSKLPGPCLTRDVEARRSGCASWPHERQSTVCSKATE